MKLKFWFICLILALAFSLARIQSIQAGQYPVPAFDYPDALIPPDLQFFSPERLSAASPSPSYYETSEYLIGSVTVGVIFLESNGTIDPSTEDWTSTEESQVVSEIQVALNWWSSQNPSAHVSFTQTVEYSVPTSYEPINRPQSDEGLWIGQAMSYLGYSGDFYFTQVRDYINALRNSARTDWAFAIFIVDSFNDPDGRFADGSYFAYAYLGGPFLVMTYDNNGWGIGNMDRVTAHEIGHIFYATDEYNGVTEYCGYLNVADVDGSGALMDVNAWWLSSGTVGQIGWRDSDGDGIQDIIDTFPNTVLDPHLPDPTIETVLTYVGNVAEVPYPNNNPYGTSRDVTINKIVNVEFRVDAYPWSSAQSSDGNFDQAEETFTFVTASHRPRNHTIVAKGTNSVGNANYASDTLTTLGPSCQEWNKTYSEASLAYSIIQTGDGGYAAVGKTTGSQTDAWLAKLNSTGGLEWSRTYGGTGIDVARALIMTSDGGYAFAGYTASFGAGSYDIWLVKTNSVGEMSWMETYGGTDLDVVDGERTIVQTPDGGYAIAGDTFSFTPWGIWLIKTDSNGKLQWSKTYQNGLTAHSIVRVGDDGFALAGGFYQGLDFDFLLVRTDSAGNLRWFKRYGGTSDDIAHSLIQTKDGGYALSGEASSFGAGSYDVWLVKTDADGIMQWNRTYGGSDVDDGMSLLGTTDGGYAIMCRQNSFGAGNSDFWLVKTDSSGNIQWDEIFGGGAYDTAVTIAATSGGGYLLAGSSGSYSWLVKVSSAASRIRVPMDYLTIQKAINIASPGNVIQVATGTYYEHVVVNKTVSLVGENQENTIIAGLDRTEFLMNITVSNVIVEGFTLRNGHHAIHASSPQYEYLDNIVIRNNTITQNNLGVLISYPRYCRVENNVVSSNRWAILLFGNPMNLGLENTVRGNVITRQEWSSIDIMWSSGTKVVGNTISFNSGTEYYYSGLGLWHSDHTTVYHNNFIENFNHVYLEESHDSIWDDGYPSGGNYWSDYTGMDLYWGPFQSKTGSDGIGDTTYVIDGDNQDYYPLMSPYEYWSNPIPGDINKDMIVDSRDLSQVATAYGSTTEKPNWNPNCDINGDGQVAISDLFDLGKNYGETAQTMGASVVEKTSPTTALPIFTVLSMLGVFVGKRKQPKKPKDQIQHPSAH